MLPPPHRHEPAAPTTLATALKSGTGNLHRAAERAGIMRALLRGQIGRPAYCLLLHNLHALYGSLEGHLGRHAAHPFVAGIPWYELRRADALAGDLAVLHGPRWRDELATGPAMQRYVARLDAIAATEPALLVAHAYVRYLGDLSGGQLLRGVVAKTFGLEGDDGLAFYRFAGEPESLAARLRAGLNALPAAPLTPRLVDEARSAFGRHIELFVEIETASRPPHAASAAGLRTPGVSVERP